MSEKVLLVDDEPQIIRALSRALADEAYEIITAGSAEEALEILAKTAVDAIVSDERMPGMPGTEFLALASERWPETIRIMLTGHANLDNAINAINQGQIYRFFTKPWNDTDLTVTIRQALEQKRLADHNRELLRKIEAQDHLLRKLEKHHPGISTVVTEEDGTVVVDDVEDAEECLKSFLTDEPE